MKLSDYRISTKILSVIVLLGIVSGGITVMGSYGINQISIAAEKINESGKEVRLGAQTYITMLMLSRGEYRAAVAPHEIDEIKPLIEQYKKQFDERFSGLKSSLADTHRFEIEQMEKSYSEYVSLSNHTFALAEKYKSLQQGEQQKEIYQSVIDARKKATEVTDMITKINNDLSSSNDKLETDTKAMSSMLEKAMIMVALGGIAIGLLVGSFISKKGIVEPMKAIVDCLGKLAAGQLNIDIFGTDRKDEVGDIAHTTLVFKENMIKAKEAEEAEARERLVKEERQKKINAATDRFQNAMQEIVKSVASASTELQSSAQTLAATAEETSKQSASVAAASEQATVNVQTVASASEEMTASISEIAEKVTRSSQIARMAVDDARKAGTSVSDMVEAAKKISDVTEMISNISAQTNLLALNATIEAARAGDAGKGFAVVASEVKNLANSSAKATDEISEQILSVQQISQQSAQAIDGICTIIKEIDEISAAIAAAIQEQTAATQEISRNAVEASKGTDEVSNNISSVNEAANSTGASSHQVLSAAQELAQQANMLKSEFDTFVEAIKAA